MSVTASGLDLEDSRVHCKNGDIKRPATQIKNDNIRLILFTPLLRMQSIRQGCGGRLINNALHIKPSDAPSILSCLPLLIIEVSRDCDNCSLDCMP